METSIKVLLNWMLKHSSVLHWPELKNLVLKGEWYKLYVRHQCIRKALFLFFFTGTKAHWKQIDPEGLTWVLSCRKILLWTKSCMGEAVLLWSTCQAFCSEIQKPAVNNFTAIFFWPALLHISHRLGSGHCILVGSGNVSQVHAPCLEALGAAPGACLSPCPVPRLPAFPGNQLWQCQVGFRQGGLWILWVAGANGSNAMYPQLSMAAENSNFISA